MYPYYTPTLEQIKKETAKIREGWSEEDHIARSMVNHGNTGICPVQRAREIYGWKIPVIRTPIFTFKEE